MSLGGGFGGGGVPGDFVAEPSWIQHPDKSPVPPGTSWFLNSPHLGPKEYNEPLLLELELPALTY